MKVSEISSLLKKMIDVVECCERKNYKIQHFDQLVPKEKSPAIHLLNIVRDASGWS